MQVYVKRGIQGRVKDAVDYDLNKPFNNTSFRFNTSQYEPYYFNASYTCTTQDQRLTENMQTGGGVVRGITGSTRVRGNRTVGW